MSNRELDRWIALNVMGYLETKDPNQVLVPLGDGSYIMEIPHYTSKIEEAWKVRLEMQRKGWISHDDLTYFGWGTDSYKQKRWGYSFWFERWETEGQRHDKICFNAGSQFVDQAPWVICICAKKALEGHREKFEEKMNLLKSLE